MDIQTLYNCLGASYHHDITIRSQAEQQLKAVESQPGFIPVLVQLIGTPDSDESIKLSASIYLKNSVQNRWVEPYAGTTYASKPWVPIPDQDKQFLKDHILELLVNAPARILVQLRSILGKITDHDFPSNWEGYGDKVVALATQSESRERTEAGLVALVELYKVYRWNDKKPREAPYLVSSVVFPALLQLGTRILSQPLSPADLHTLYLVMKVYKTSILIDLSPSQQADESIIPWVSFILSLVMKEQSAEQKKEEEDLENDMKAKSMWWKMKKWAFFSLNRLWARFGRPSSLRDEKRMQEYLAFADKFERNLAPQILTSYLRQIEIIITTKAYYPPKCINHILSFIDDCIKPKVTWDILQPHIQPLLSQFVFPLLNQTEEELEEFKDDPIEYSRSHYAEFVEEYFESPESGATSVILSLAEGRKKSTLVPMLHQINEIVSKYPAVTTPIQKDGAMRILGILSSVLRKTKIMDMIPTFMTNYVYPELESPHGFLRARACDLVKQFEEAEISLTEETLKSQVRLMLKALEDPEIPVRVCAFMALPELVGYEEVADALAPNCGKILQDLLNLSDQLDIDALTQTSRSLVSQFSEQIHPFAVQLSQQTAASYLRIMHEQMEVRNRVGRERYEEDFDPSGEEKTLVAMSLLKTMEQLVLAMEQRPDLLPALEDAIVPCISFTIVNDFYELYREVFELTDSMSFSQRSISPTLWSVFEGMHQCFMKGGADYFDEMLGTIDNFVTYGQSTFATTPKYRQMIVEMFNHATTSAGLGAHDHCLACKMAQSALLNLKGSFDEGLEPFVSRAMSFLLDPKKLGDLHLPLQLHSILLIAHAMYYNPVATLSILEANGWTTNFFSQWFTHRSELTRVYDRKISLLALCAVLQSLPSLPQSIQDVVRDIVAGTLAFFDGLPEAIETKENQETAFNSSDGDAPNYGAMGGDEEEDYFDVDPLTEIVRRQMAKERQAEEDDTSEAWTEEVLFETPLDNLDSYVIFVQVMRGLEASRPDLSQKATTDLSTEQRTLLEHIMQRASGGGEKARFVQIS
ncbi:ARM repeat-containing protein [Atractiella rhizophila]|nr:ARM repeat-containing protein [Atractiella rhizophila]